MCFNWKFTVAVETEQVEIVACLKQDFLQLKSKLHFNDTGSLSQCDGS